MNKLLEALESKVLAKIWQTKIVKLQYSLFYHSYESLE